MHPAWWTVGQPAEIGSVVCCNRRLKCSHLDWCSYWLASVFAITHVSAQFRGCGHEKSTGLWGWKAYGVLTVAVPSRRRSYNTHKMSSASTKWPLCAVLWCRITLAELCKSVIPMCVCLYLCRNVACDLRGIKWRSVRKSADSPPCCVWMETSNGF